jgi:hypothetical protein
MAGAAPKKPRGDLKAVDGGAVTKPNTLPPLPK